MQVSEIDWPEDLTWAEEQATDATEERIREIAAGVDAESDPPTRGDLQRLYHAIDAKLFAGSPSPIAGRLRIITRFVNDADDGRDGIAVRLRWTRHERDRREAEVRAAHAAAILAGDRGSSDSHPSDLVAKAFEGLATALAAASEHAKDNPRRERPMGARTADAEPDRRDHHEGADRARRG